ncbi:histidine kinase [Mastigocladus laminosus UU774]|nr:histidine kinase [Mastigocladus laminosus UU774]
MSKYAGKSEGRGDKGKECGETCQLSVISYQIKLLTDSYPMPNAQCPMPHTQCPMPNAH